MNFSDYPLSDVLVCPGSAASDGFLSSAEYSLWASTMRLKDEEAHPTLKQSHFMSLPADVPPEVSFNFFMVYFHYYPALKRSNKKTS